MKSKSLSLVLVLLLSSYLPAAGLQVIKFPAEEVSGTGPLPYNYRVVGGTLHAGGHPLNPATSFGNSDEQTLAILNYLKTASIETVIDLENTKKIQARYQRLLNKAGLKRIHIPLNSLKVPNKKEWAVIKAALKKPAYLHCAWGADRTGMAIARYLVEEKGFSPDSAYAAVISGGQCAGPLGGFKKWVSNGYLKSFIYTGPK
ncbi:MAG: tyrosine-protein phosphatase [Candidatus Margulisbacteria bacterium]|nr:tyrosine-protein phosphatase [Candidatus Margulisiibacteriota bacterium]